MGHEVEVPMVKVPGSAGEWVDQETGFPSLKEKAAWVADNTRDVAGLDLVEG